MELEAVQTRSISKSNRSSLVKTTEHPKTPENKSSKPITTLIPTSPETALKILKAKPSHDELIKVLNYLLSRAHQQSSPPHPPPPLSSSSATASTTAIKFNINVPTTQTALIAHTLITDVVPIVNWLNENQDDIRIRRLLIKCLRNVTGLGGLVSHLRLLLDGIIRDSKTRGQSQAGIAGSGESETRLMRPLGTFVRVLEDVLSGEGFLAEVCRDLRSATTASSVCDSSTVTGQNARSNEAGAEQRFELMWKEISGLVAGGRIVSVVGEAERTRAELGGKNGSWIGDGVKFGWWLGRNIWVMVSGAKEVGGEGEEFRAAGQVLGKGLKLGYIDSVVEATFADLISGDDTAIQRTWSLLDHLGNHEQRLVLNSAVRITERRYLSPPGRQTTDVNYSLIGAAAALLSALIIHAPIRKNIMIDWLVAMSAEALRHAHLTHRVVVLALSIDIESVKAALLKALESFADKLFIKHTPIFQQELNAQVLLLLSSYVFRGDKESLEKISKSSLYLNSISNHLASTSSRARFLGMVVGTAVSDLVDRKENRMNFSSEEMEGSDGRWYRHLASIQDSLGSIKDLDQLSNMKRKPSNEKGIALSIVNRKKPSSKVPVKRNSKTVSIEELDDTSSSGDDDDLPTYAKPDSDPEDSDENPELVQRSKPTAPVYIRDLLTDLRDLDSYEKHSLALSTAPLLIRRKVAFGSEVIDNIEDLAMVLTGLNDKYEMDSFHTWRLQAMIALIVADPSRMGPWFAHAFYNGEYSISQRASVLTTLGLGAREIAGLGKEDEAMTGWTSEKQSPSKQLPEKLHDHYATLPPPPSSTFALTPQSKTTSSSSSATPIDTLSSSLSKSLLQPLAAQATDTHIGPNVLKIRTVSSRLAVKERTQNPSSNPLAKILAEAFFYPLVGRWSGSNKNIITHSQTISTTSAITTSPFLLSHLLRTLALILHASGATSPDLPRITSEFWDFLLSVRSLAVELPVLEAVLFALLTLLEVNIARNERRVAEEHARELLETQAWVEVLFEERIAEGGSEEDERVRMVAAGVLVRCRETVERWQRVLMGDLMGYL